MVEKSLVAIQATYITLKGTCIQRDFQTMIEAEKFFRNKKNVATIDITCTYVTSNK